MSGSYVGRHGHHGGHGRGWGRGFYPWPYPVPCDPFDPRAAFDPSCLATLASVSGLASNLTYGVGGLASNLTFGVGAAPSKVRKLLDERKQKAWDASSKASDSGTIAFGEHRAYTQALKDNRAARRAWDDVSKLAGGYPSEPGAPTDLEDAHARMGELDVAAQQLAFDAASHMVIGPNGLPGAKHKLKRPHVVIFPKSSSVSLLNQGGAPGAPVSPSRLGLAAAALVGIGTKLAGWW